MKLKIAQKPFVQLIHSDSSLVEFDVGTAHSRVEGIYSCIAHSRDMNKPLMGRADTFLDVTGI